MDWAQQVESMMSAWTDTQRKLWDNYFDSMQSATRTPGARAWQQTLGMGEEMFKSMFKAQSDAIDAWVAGMDSLEGTPAQALESARKFQDMNKHWLRTQEQLVENWFAMLRKLSPPGASDAWTDLPKTMFGTWQSTTQNIMDSQMEFLRAWTGQGKK